VAIAEEKGERIVSAEEPSQLTTSEAPKLHPIRRLRELWRYREILANLTRKEVKVKYTSSVLGAAWAMLNPLLFLGVFWFIFGVVLPNHLPNFPIYILSSILAWNVYNGSLTLSARSVVENANLVKKVYFPREILPLASIGASLVDFVFQAIVLAVFLAILTYNPFGLNLVLLPLAFVALLLFTVALSLFVAALNVRYRDTQHLLNLALLMWFWLTPVVYQFAAIEDRIQHSRFGQGGLYAYLILNPMATIVAGFQRAIYRVVTPTVPAVKQVTAPDGHVHTIHYRQAVRALLDFSIGRQAELLAISCGISILLILFTWRRFFRQAGDFAEEL
jgi:ABC-2 type transport system permease protein